MAIYHCHVKMVSRSTGRSSVAAAAYRAGEKIKNEQTGETHYFQRKVGVRHSEIILPENAPREYQERKILWNAVEKSETRVNSQTAREVELALPVELDIQQQKEVVREYIQENFVKKGMCADFSIHDKLDGNPHAHIMLTTREVGLEGFEVKNRTWNDRKNIELWRGNWADICNRKFEQLGICERIDHRSLEDQGINRVPTIHLGAAHQMEERDISTRKGQYHRDVKELNELNNTIRIAQKESVAIEKELTEMRATEAEKAERPETSVATPPHKQNAKTQHGSDLTRQATSKAAKTPEIEPEAEIKPEAPKQKAPAVWRVEPVTEADDIATIDEKLEKIEQMQRERNKYNDAAKELGNDKYLAMVQERLAEIEKTNAELEKLKQANWAFDLRDPLGKKKVAEVNRLTAKKEKLITGLEQPMRSLKINLKGMNARIPIKALQNFIPPKEKAGDNIAVAKWLVSKVMGAIGALNNKAAVLDKPIPSIDTQIIWGNIRKGKLKEQERAKKLEQGYESHERPGREIGGRER